ncbi:hypothetical protein RBXJA2T_13794 [Rubrivivax benzoatilyticus JA2 = ATCC BAA-35]|nr:hypothetical protein RBXJA2T_13794 [Rubrivivax benzoatilyticus JA2 = ATCC BAA-35]
MTLFRQEIIICEDEMRWSVARVGVCRGYSFTLETN